MATKTQTKSDSRSSTGRLLHWMNNSPTFEIWLGIALMYSHTIALTLLHSWNLEWVVPIGVYFLVSGMSEKVAKMADEGDL